MHEIEEQGLQLWKIVNEVWLIFIWNCQQNF